MPTELNVTSATANIAIGGAHNPHRAKPIERSARDGDVPCGGGDCGDIFEAFLDTINPLQQLPGVSTLYRAASGDGISTIARLAGGALFGGPIGFIVSAVNAGIEAATGADVGGHLMAMFGGEETTKVAAATSAYGKAAKLG